MKPKAKRIIIDIAIIILGVVLLIFGIKDVIKSNTPVESEDSIKFREAFKETSKYNIYSTVTLNRVKSILSTGTGVVLIGNSEDEYTQKITEVLNEALKGRTGTIYYFDTEGIVNELNDYNLDLSNIPLIVFVKNGERVSVIDKLTIYKNDNIDNYWNNDNKKEFKELIKDNITKIK